MDLDELYGHVSTAIHEAETLEASGRRRDAAMAYLRVSRLEEQIAAILPASHSEGALARQGVVTAALGAGDAARAAERARHYLREAGLPDGFVKELGALAVEAEAELRTLQGGPEPAVVPVRFKLGKVAA